MAYDHMPNIGAFVQVWDHTKGDGEMCLNSEEEEYFNGVEEHSCLTTGGRNLTEEFVINIAKKYGIPINEAEVYRIFD